MLSTTETEWKTFNLNHSMELLLSWFISVQQGYFKHNFHVEAQNLFILKATEYKVSQKHV